APRALQYLSQAPRRASVAIRQRQQPLRRLAVRLGLEERLAEALADDEVDAPAARPFDVERGALVLDRRDRRLLAEAPGLALSRLATDRADPVVGRDAIGAHHAFDPNALAHRLRWRRPARLHLRPDDRAEGVVERAEARQLGVAAKPPERAAVEPVRVEGAGLAVPGLERADPVVPAD